MIAYSTAHHACTYVPKSFPTLTINGTNCLSQNIIIYKLDSFTDVVILKIPISRLSLPFH